MPHNAAVTTSTRSHGTGSPLGVPGFRTLAAAYSINELGNWLGDIALAILVYDETRSALATALLFVAVRFVPALTAPAIVARVERLGPRTALSALYGLDAVVFAVLAVLATREFVLAAIVVLAALDGTLALAARALTRSTSAALLSPHGLLRRGNAVFNFGFTGAFALGPAIAGLVVAHAGVSTALALDAGSFAFVALLIAASTALPAGEHAEGSWRGRMREALEYIRGRRLLSGVLLAQAAAFLFFYAVIPIEVVYAKKTLESGNTGYGWLLTAWGVGMIVGGLVFAWAQGVRIQLLLGLGTVAIGGAYLGLAAAPNLGVACAISVIGGIGNGIQWISLVNVVQELTTAAMQARVLGVLEAIGAALPAAGFFAGGAVATLGSPRTAYVFSGIGVVITLTIAGFGLRNANWPARGTVAPEEPTALAGRAPPAS